MISQSRTTITQKHNKRLHSETSIHLEDIFPLPLKGWNFFRRQIEDVTLTFCLHDFQHYWVTVCGSCGSLCLHETRISNTIEIKLSSERKKIDDYVVQSSWLTITGNPGSKEKLSETHSVAQDVSKEFSWVFNPKINNYYFLCGSAVLEVVFLYTFTWTCLI